MRRVSRLVGFFTRLRKVARSFPSFSSSAEEREEVLDRIDLKELQLFGYHGLSSEEQRNGQKFRIGASLFLSLPDKGLDSEQGRAIRYDSVYEDIAQVMSGPSVHFIEQLAEKMCDTILAEYPPIKKVQVSIRKEEKCPQSFTSDGESSSNGEDHHHLEDSLLANVEAVRNSPSPPRRRSRRIIRECI